MRSLLKGCGDNFTRLIERRIESMNAHITIVGI
jgi:hypothetical protein